MCCKALTRCPTCGGVAHYSESEDGTPQFSAVAQEQANAEFAATVGQSNLCPRCLEPWYGVGVCDACHGLKREPL